VRQTRGAGDEGAGGIRWWVTVSRVCRKAPGGAVVIQYGTECSRYGGRHRVQQVGSKARFGWGGGGGSKGGVGDENEGWGLDPGSSRRDGPADFTGGRSHGGGWRSMS
jgi:hypothetical protein